MWRLYKRWAFHFCISSFIYPFFPKRNLQRESGSPSSDGTWGEGLLKAAVCIMLRNVLCESIQIVLKEASVHFQTSGEIYSLFPNRKETRKQWIISLRDLEACNIICWQSGPWWVSTEGIEQVHAKESGLFTLVIPSSPVCPLLLLSFLDFFISLTGAGIRSRPESSQCTWIH